MPHYDLDLMRHAGHLDSTATNASVLRALRGLAVLGAICIGPTAFNSAYGAPGDATVRQGEYAEGGVPSRGLAYAKETCAACHAVAAGETKSPIPEAPAFESVANTPGMTKIALDAWLHTSHPTMPNLIIDPTRIEDLSAYLSTLKKD